MKKSDDSRSLLPDKGRFFVFPAEHDNAYAQTKKGGL